MSYRTEDEKRYYGSDYNKYINTECRKDMTVMNIDCLQWDFKLSILRIVESKHVNEYINKDSFQFKALNFIATIFEWLNKIAKRYTFQIYLVVGSPPYQKLMVENLLTGVTSILTGDDVKVFSELKLSP